MAAGFLAGKISGNAPQGPYPVVVERSDGTRCLVVQDFWLGKYMGMLTVTWDDKGQPVKWEGQPVLLDKSIPQGTLSACFCPCFVSTLFGSKRHQCCTNVVEEAFLILRDPGLKSRKKMLRVSLSFHYA